MYIVDFLLYNWLNMFTYDDFVNWYIQHPRKRIPTTPELLLSQNKITPELMEEYMSRPLFKDDCAVKAQKWGQARLPELIHKVYDLCVERPSASNIDAYLKLVGMGGGKGSDGDDADRHDPFDLSKFNISDEQRKQIANRLSGRGSSDDNGGEEGPAHI